MNSKLLPYNIRKCMDKSQRKSMGIRTDHEIQAKVDSVSEREVQKQISNWLRLKGIWFDNPRMDKRPTGVLGRPDYLLAYKYGGLLATPLAIEVKVNGNDLSDDQKKVREQMIENRWHYYIVSSLQEVMEIMKDTV